MSNETHPLLQRQLTKLKLSPEDCPDLPSWQNFLERVNASYKEEDKSRYLLERSLAISSEEMRQLHDNLRESAARLAAEKEKLERWSHFRIQLIEFVSGMLTRGLNEHFYEQLLAGAVQLIPGADAGSILIKAKDGYHYKAAHGFDLEALKHVYFREDELHIATSGRLCITPNLPSKQTLDRERIAILESAGRLHDIQDSLIMSIMVDGTIAAILNLNSFSSAKAFSTEALEMAEVFAAQVGALFQRFRLARELEQTNLELARLANYDVLTTLPNRSLFQKELRETLAGNLYGHVALLFLDLDGFKDVNDSLGHDIGDSLLKQVAARLKTCVRKSDTVSRLGGDEFTVILPNLSQPEDASKVAQKILQQLADAFHPNGHEVFVTTSIGIAVFPDHSQDADTLTKLADTAMYHAKSLGKNCYYFFTEDIQEKTREKRELERKLRQAIERDEFVLHYQPRVYLSSGELTSLEALLRWQHPEEGLIYPDKFIALAEESALIHQLGILVLRKVCRQAKSWADEGWRLRVAYNLSVKQLQHDDIVTIIAQVLAEVGLEPSLLELEITESAAMTNVEANIEKLKQFKAMGIYTSIDDFGTAYSSLNYLKQLPVSSLKIDKSFVQDIGEDPSPANAAIIRSVIALGKNMDLELIAEGVETSAQATFLTMLGCNEAQGYYFSKPLPPEVLSERYQRNKETLLKI